MLSLGPASTSMLRASGAAFALVLLSGQTVISGQGSPVSAHIAQRPVPAVVVDVARTGSVGDLARELAKTKSIAGIIIKRRDAPFSTKGAELLERPQASSTAGGTLGDALAAFLGNHASYRVAQQDDGILIAPDNSVCVPPLKHILTDLRISGPAFAAGFELMRAIDPKLSSLPPPTAMSSGRQQTASLILQPVALYYQRLTVREALDEISRQVPGLVWVFVEDVDRRTGKPLCFLHWFTASEVGSTNYDLLGGSGK